MENRKLIDYLPEFIQEYLEMRQIMEAQQPEADDLNDGVARAWANQFLSDADEYGVGRWEKILGIAPKAMDTLDERKTRILAWWTSERPYTLTKLREKLEAICGDNVTVTVTHEAYTINVELTISGPSAIESTQEVVYRMRPANMVVHIKIIYKKAEPTYVGMAYKSTKVVTPTDKEPIDPMGDVTMFVYGDDLLTDSYKNPLKDAKET